MTPSPEAYTRVDLPGRAVVGLVSDTHGWYHDGLDTDLAGCDVILHAGDVGTPDILDRLEQIAPTYAVWGNVDGRPIRNRAPEHQRLDLGGLRVWMTHIGGHPKRWAKGIGSDPDMPIRPTCSCADTATSCASSACRDWGGCSMPIPARRVGRGSIRSRRACG